MSSPDCFSRLLSCSHLLTARGASCSRLPPRQGTIPCATLKWDNDWVPSLFAVLDAGWLVYQSVGILTFQFSQLNSLFTGGFLLVPDRCCGDQEQNRFQPWSFIVRWGRHIYVGIVLKNTHTLGVVEAWVRSWEIGKLRQVRRIVRLSRLRDGQQHRRFPKL